MLQVTLRAREAEDGDALKTERFLQYTGQNGKHSQYYCCNVIDI